MHLLGVGIDVVDIVRVERLLARKGDRALARFLTERERVYVTSHGNPAPHLAARIAAKEAVYKALQTLPEAAGVGWRDLEVLRRVDGRPAIQLHGLAERLAHRHGPLEIQLSLSHSHSSAAAVAVIVVNR